MREPQRTPTLGRRPAFAGVAALAIAGAWLAAGALAPASQVPSGAVRVSSSGDDSELKKTIPIGRRSGDHRNVVYSIGPGNLGAIADGDRLEAMGEVEVTICLKKDPDHPGPAVPCVGDVYGYNPYVKGEIVLSPGKDVAGGARTRTIVPQKRIQCSQQQPHRNHHCVLSMSPESIEIPNAGDLPCQPDDCHVNFVVEAYHRNSRSGEKIVIGSSDSSLNINGDKGRVGAVRYRPAGIKDAQPIEKRRPERSGLPIASHTSATKTHVVYSMKVPDLKAGEQLAVDGKLVAKIGRQSYSTFTTSEIILTTRPTAVEPQRRAGKVTGSNSQIASANGFNCTQGPSAHRTPCTARKLGVVSIVKTTHQPLFLNLVAGMRAMFPSDKWRSGDAAKIARKRGFLRLYRYTPQ